MEQCTSVGRMALASFWSGFVAAARRRFDVLRHERCSARFAREMTRRSQSRARCALHLRMHETSHHRQLRRAPTPSRSRVEWEATLYHHTERAAQEIQPLHSRYRTPTGARIVTVAKCIKSPRRLLRASEPRCAPATSRHKPRPGCANVGRDESRALASIQARRRPAQIILAMAPRIVVCGLPNRWRVVRIGGALTLVGVLNRISSAFGRTCVASCMSCANFRLYKPTRPSRSQRTVLAFRERRLRSMGTFAATTFTRGHWKFRMLRVRILNIQKNKKALEPSARFA